MNTTAIAKRIGILMELYLVTGSMNISQMKGSSGYGMTSYCVNLSASSHISSEHATLRGFPMRCPVSSW